MVGIDYEYDIFNEAKKSREWREWMERNDWGQYAEYLWWKHNVHDTGNFISSEEYFFGHI